MKAMIGGDSRKKLRRRWRSCESPHAVRRQEAWAPLGVSANENLLLLDLSQEEVESRQFFFSKSELSHMRHKSTTCCY